MSSPLTPLAHFAWMMDMLCGRVGAGHKVFTPAVLVVLLARLRRLARRFAGLVARYRDGVLHPSRKRARGARPQAAEGDGTTQGAPPACLTLPGMWRDHGWLVTLVPEMISYRAWVTRILHEPEMEAMLASAPQFGRVLRPLLHALGFAEGAFPLLARPARQRRKPALVEIAPAAPQTADAASAGPEPGSPDPVRPPSRRLVGLSGVRVRRPRYV